MRVDKRGVHKFMAPPHCIYETQAAAGKATLVPRTLLPWASLRTPLAEAGSARNVSRFTVDATSAVLIAVGARYVAGQLLREGASFQCDAASRC